MDKRLDIYEAMPRVGVGPVRFGMTREQVRRTIPGPRESFLKGLNAQHEVDAFHNGGFQIFYGGEPPVAEYIELSRDSGFRVVCHGADVVATPAGELAAVLSGDPDFDASHAELGYAYVFTNSDVSLWRPAIPKFPADPSGREFSTIGLGVAGYYHEDE
jgi:hypothetical protein